MFDATDLPTPNAADFAAHRAEWASVHAIGFVVLVFVVLALTAAAVAAEEKWGRK